MKELIQTPVGSIFRKHLVSAPDTIRHCDAINGCGKDGPKFSYRTLEIGITEPNSPDVSIEVSDDNTIRIGIPNILVEGFCNKITASLKVQAEPFRVPALVLCEKGVVEGNLWFRTWMTKDFFSVDRGMRLARGITRTVRNEQISQEQKAIAW